MIAILLSMKNCWVRLVSQNNDASILPHVGLQATINCVLVLIEMLPLLYSPLQRGEVPCSPLCIGFR